MKRSWVYATVCSNEAPPHWWLGRAWYDLARDRAVYMPVPLNVVAAQLLHLWWWIKRGGTRQHAIAYHAGYDAGWRDGYKRGLHEGEQNAAALFRTAVQHVKGLV